MLNELLIKVVLRGMGFSTPHRLWLTAYSLMAMKLAKIKDLREDPMQSDGVDRLERDVGEKEVVRNRGLHLLQHVT
jgi:hypothetical protein